MRSNANKITVAIPAFNNQDVISEAITSALNQGYPLKEILVCDDCSSDKTAEIARGFKIKVVVNEHNLGIGKNLEKLMQLCETRFIIYLCADDFLTHPKVLSDIVRVFDTNPDIGVIGRYYYHFMNGQVGAIGVCRDKNILTSSCCPSGMAFRRNDDVKVTSRIFIEMPSLVAQYLKKYRWTMLEYDVFASRYHPGGNTGTKSSYYTESPTQNWIDLLGQNYQDFPVFITLKNRSPHLLWREICLHVRNDKKVLSNPSFWFYSLTALLCPQVILKKLSVIYRNWIARKSASIIERPSDV